MFYYFNSIPVDRVLDASSVQFSFIRPDITVLVDWAKKQQQVTYLLAFPFNTYPAATTGT